MLGDHNMLEVGAKIVGGGGQRLGDANVLECLGEIFLMAFSHSSHVRCRSVLLPGSSAGLREWISSLVRLEMAAPWVHVRI